MLSIFKPGLRRVVAEAASYSCQGIFEGYRAVLLRLKEQKTVSQMLNTSVLKPKTTGMGKCKPGKGDW